MNTAIRLSRLLLAAVFFYAGVVKLGASERFAITLAQFYVLPQHWIGAFAFALPCLEILVAVALVVPRTARIGAFVTAALLAAFLAALSWAWSQGFTVDCGCFGATEDEPVAGNQIPLAIARDSALLAITLLLAGRRLR